MIVYFSLYCFLGFWMESIYVSLFQKKWISSGLLKGPFIPIYGFGSWCLIAAYPYLHNHPFLSFFIGGIMMTMIEYISSLFIEKCFDTKCWDYSHFPFQFQGRICLFYFIIWCIISYLFIHYLHPYVISCNIVNDITCLISLIYMMFILRAFINRCQLVDKNKATFHL